MPIFVRIVVVAYNNLEDIQRLLNSLIQHWKTPAEIIICDNGSCTAITQHWNSIPSGQRAPLNLHVIGDGRNVGFSAAANRGAREKTEGLPWTHLLLLNPDATLASDVDADVLRRLSELPGILGLRVFDDEKKKHRQYSARSFPGWLTSISGREGILTKLWPNNPFSKKYLSQNLAADEVQKVDWVSGCALWTDRHSWERLKGFDESYFLYVEDVDLGRKATQLGIPVSYVPWVDIVHESRGSSKVHKTWKSDFHHHMGMWVYHVKWSGPVGWLFGPLVFLGIWLRFLARRF